MTGLYDEESVSKVPPPPLLVKHGRGDDGQPERSEVTPVELPGSLSEFRLVDSIELKQRPKLPIVRVSGLPEGPYKPEHYRY
ncbi:MAG TPA: hypothetical protein VF187_12170 [Gemmatimonadales bacterium]